MWWLGWDFGTQRYARNRLSEVASKICNTAEDELKIMFFGVSRNTPGTNVAGLALQVMD